jgi:sigma-B regulation protein RsbU (phosphoserine phosphatase)
VPGYDIAGALLPAEFAAGDYYDYLRMPDGSLGIAVGDVAGHGFSAALLMVSVSARLRSLAVKQSDIREILRKLNTVLCQEIEEDRFVTLVFVQIELASRRLRYVNLGHPSGYVLGQSGDVKYLLESSDLPLGILSAIDLPISEQIELEPDDIILLATDGIGEAHSPEGAPFGTERMLEVVRANRDRRASEIIKSLQQAVFDFTGLKKPQDDLTAVVIKVEASSS